jgi:hypothetical protein
MNKILVFLLSLSFVNVFALDSEEVISENVEKSQVSEEVQGSAASRFQEEVKKQFNSGCDFVLRNKLEVLSGVNFTLGFADGYNSRLTNCRNSKLKAGFPIAALLSGWVLHGRELSAMDVPFQLASYYFGNRVGKFSQSLKKVILNR